MITLVLASAIDQIIILGHFIHGLQFHIEQFHNG